MDYIEVSGKNVDEALTNALIKLETTSDKVEYEVIEKGSAGFLGMGERLFAVPFGALRNDGVKGQLYLDVDEEKFNTAPYIDPNDWPDMADKNWIREVHAFYGVEPYLMGM